MDAPTQYASMSLSYTPNKQIHADVGYRISAVSGNQFFNDAQEVNGSLQSAYQSPFINVAYTVHPGWIWRVEYNYYGYGEGGPSGAPYCSLSTSATAVVVPCNSSTLAGLPTGLTEPSSGLTAPRNFHANNVTLGMHYEF
jgi:opacity protein-like surface antigen